MSDSIGFPNSSPLDSDLSCGERYLMFEKLGPEGTFSSESIEGPSNFILNCRTGHADKAIPCLRSRRLFTYLAYT